jgi:hypothetical protein
MQYKAAYAVDTLSASNFHDKKRDTLAGRRKLGSE